MDTNKGQGWKVLLSLSMIAAIAVLPYLGTKWFGGGDKVTEPGTAPLTGNSKAVSIEPVEGIRIAAAENAMDKDREIQFDYVNEKQWNRAVKALKNEDTTPLCAFEFNAGMAPDEHIPGTFDISVDLDEMGIPPVLYDRMQVWRVADDGSYYRYSSRVKGNQLCFKSNQNSFILITLGAVAILYGNMKFVHYCQEYSMRKFFNIVQTTGDPLISIPYEDPEGDFTIYFSFYTTERPGGGKAFMENEKKAMERLAVLEKQADRKLGEKADLAVSGRALNWWERWQLKDQREEAKKTIDREAILQELINNDPVMKELNSSPDANLPQSVQKAIDMVKLSNYYLNHIAQVKPLTFNQEVYLVNGMVIGSDNGRNVTRVGGKPFLLINMDNMLETDPKTKQLSYSNSPAKGQSTLLTITHELFHARQQMNYCDIHMGMFAAESTAAVLEVDAARWYYKNGNITANVDADGNGGLQLSPRMYLSAFARPLNDISASDKYTILDLGSPSRLYEKTTQELSDASDVGYTLAYFIEAVREYANKHDRSMHYVVEQYPEYGKRFSEMVRMGMPLSERAFDNAWVWFCDRNMKSLYESQYLQEGKDILSGIMTECYTKELTLSEADAAHDLEMIPGKNFYFRTWHVGIDRMSGKEYNFFVTNRYNNQEISPYVHFFTVSDKKDFHDGGENGENLYVKHPESVRIGAAVTSYAKQETPDDYWGVALFKPRAIKIKKLYEDSIELELPPISKILLQKGLVTGAIITYYPKEGAHQEKKVFADALKEPVFWSVKDIGKDGGQFGLTVQWYFEESEGIVYKSPESDVVYHRMGEEEEPTGEGGFGETEGPGLEGWKLVRVEEDNSRTSDVLRHKGWIDNEEVEYYSSYSVDGNAGLYKAHCEYWTILMRKEGQYNVNDKPGLGLTYDQTCRFDVPKSLYQPGESIVIRQEKSEGVKEKKHYSGSWSNGDVYPRFFVNYDILKEPRSSQTIHQAYKYHFNATQDSDLFTSARNDVVVNVTAPLRKENAPNGFVITQGVSAYAGHIASNGDGTDLECCRVTRYYYEWTGSQEDLPITLLGVSISGTSSPFYYMPQRHPGDAIVSLSPTADGYLFKGTNHVNECSVEIHLDKKMVPVTGSYSSTRYSYSFGHFSLVEQNRHEYGKQYVYNGQTASSEGVRLEIVLNQ